MKGTRPDGARERESGSTPLPEPLSIGAPGTAPASPLDIRRLALQVLGGAAALVLGLGLVAYFFQEPLVRLSETFVRTLGGPGIAVGFFLPDAFTIPFPNDAFTAAGLLGGMSFPLVVAWGSLGSILGGHVGLLVGRRLSYTRWFRRFMATHGQEAYALSQRYGALALVLGALTPVPYSVTCWAAGALGMRLGVFSLISLLRIPRIAVYLWLIQLGFLSFVPAG